MFKLLKNNSSSVVNFSSIGARVVRPNRSIYAAAKGGIESLLIQDINCRNGLHPQP